MGLTGKKDVVGQRRAGRSAAQPATRSRTVSAVTPAVAHVVVAAGAARSGTSGISSCLRNPFCGSLPSRTISITATTEAEVVKAIAVRRRPPISSGWSAHELLALDLAFRPALGRDMDIDHILVHRRFGMGQDLARHLAVLAHFANTLKLDVVI